MSNRDTFIKLLGDKFIVKIVFVCSGNIIRSPYAEFLVKSCLQANSIGNIKIESGACFYQNSAIIAFTRKWLRKEGFSDDEISSHIPRLLLTHEEDFSDTDIFIGMTFHHLEFLKQHFPKKNSFLLKQIVLDKNDEVLDPYFNSDLEDQIMYELKDLLSQLCAIMR